MEHSVELINPHGRRVQVVKAREAILLKQGYTKPPADKPVPDSIPSKPSKPAPKKAKKEAEPPPEPPDVGAEDESGGEDGDEVGLEELAVLLADTEKKDIAKYAMDTFSIELDPKKLTKDKMIDAVIEAARGE